MCGLAFLSPRPTLDEIGECYPSQYGEHISNGEPNAFQRTEAACVTRWSNTKAGSVLDVGCAAGYFLKAMAQLGWSVAGIEPDPEAATTAQRVSGGSVRCGVLRQEEYPEGTFDAVTLWSVIEHLHDPLATLKVARTILRPNGRLHLGLPNFGSLERRLFGRGWFALDVPRHLYHFTPKTLRILLDMAGYKVLSLSHASGHDTLKFSLRPELRQTMGKTAKGTGIEIAQRSAAGRVRREVNRFAVHGFTRFADFTRQGSQMLVVAEPKRV
jgi:2-polyprenyl-3-methyl-5-hydroxy-6-metoxy-1,4-benzoquinol methylase